MTIRPLTEVSEFERCVELQRDAFGWLDINILPIRVFVLLRHVGGLTLGAFEDNRLIGFVNAMPAFRDGLPYWHSHMMAIARDHWNRGVGASLKLAQREQAIQRGIRCIEWTFEPLKAKNAYLNIVKLGAIVRRYSPNHYGSPADGHEPALDSDRAIAEWWLDRPRPPIGGEIRRIAIPSDILALQKQSFTSAKDLQQRVRQQFLRNIEDGFLVAGFERNDEWSDYLFIRDTPNVH